MCNFLSVLVLRNGDVRHHPMLDSHTDLVKYFNLPDTSAYHQHFAKAELTPVDWLDASTWRWRIDEESRPGWLDDVEGRAEKATRAIAQRMVIKDGVTPPPMIIEGCWIVGGESVVKDVRSGRIMRVQDSATVQDVRGSATVQDVGGSATVQDVRGSATVQDVGGSATVQDVGGSATVRDVGGSATVRDVWGSATVRNVRGSSTVQDVRGSATVQDVWGSATVRNVRGSVILDGSAKAHLVKP